MHELNPILEEVVSETIKTQPDNPVEYMLHLMEKRKAAEEDKELSAEEWVRLLTRTRSFRRL